MTKRLIHCASLLIAIFALCAGLAQAQTASSQANNTASLATGRSEFQLSRLLAQARRGPRSGFSLMLRSRNVSEAAAPFTITPMAAGPNLQVLGSGTVGRLTKWTGFTSSNSFIGDSSIFEDKFGNVSIGTGSSTVTIAGTLQASGGATVIHDATLQGNGTAASPLGVAVPLVLSGAIDKPGAIVKATNTSLGDGLFGEGDDTGVHGKGFFGVRGEGSTTGVRGEGGIGVLGVGRDESGLRGGTGVHAFGGNGPAGGSGLITLGGTGSGAGNSAGDGIVAIRGRGENGAANGVAGRFTGDVQIEGNLSATGTKMFKIDHPLDPENKYLNHAAIESSEVLNVYSGNVRLDASGEATVKLPEWFEALNRDFRYSLTPIGAPGQGLYIAEEVSNNQFKIAGGQPGAKVSWQVTAIRSDAVMRNHPFKVEEDKSERERGFYLSPEAFNQPEDRSIEWARHPEVMQQLKQRRIEAEQKVKQEQR